jgi:hypothetical protein
MGEAAVVAVGTTGGVEVGWSVEVGDGEGSLSELDFLLGAAWIFGSVSTVGNMLTEGSAADS